MREIVYDVETTAKGGPKKDSPAAHWIENKLLLSGWLIDGKTYQVSSLDNPRKSYTSADEDLVAEAFRVSETDPITIIGHNLSFDLSWLVRSMQWAIRKKTKDPNSLLHAILNPNTLLWDTMIVEYMLRGQNPLHESMALEACCNWNGIKGKYNLEDAGYSIKHAEDIPVKILQHYHKDDLRCTKDLYESQLMRLSETSHLAKLPVILETLQSSKWTWFAGWNGMRFDRPGAEPKLLELEDKIGKLTTNLNVAIKSMYPWWHSPNCNSDDQIGTILFGGERTKIIDQPIIKDGEEQVFKTGLRKGEVKTRKYKQPEEIKPLCSTSCLRKVRPTKTPSGKWQVTEEVLVAIESFERDRRSKSSVSGVELFCTNLIVLRQVTKDYSTYYKAMYDHSDNPNRIIHSSIGHTSTATGRTASRSPNLQNVTNGE